MLPKQKLSRAKSRSRRAHQGKIAPAFVDCKQCNSPKLPHAACDNCGYVRPGLSLKIEAGS